MRKIIIPSIVFLLLLLSSVSVFADTALYEKGTDLWTILEDAEKADAEIESVRTLENGQIIVEATGDDLENAMISRAPKRVYPMNITNDPEVDIAEYLNISGLPKAWKHVDLSKNRPAIAVIGTGVAKHKDISVKASYNFSGDNGKTGVDADPNSHETAVAGIIGAKIGNRLDSAGICNPYILDYRVMDEDGYMTDDRVYEAGISAISEGAKVLNLSLGVYGYSEFMEELVREAKENDVLVVSAIGNYKVTCPGSLSQKYDNLISVGATTDVPVLERASFCPKSGCIDLAPIGDFVTAPHLEGGLATYNGTSFSTPIVTGCAGLLLQKYPGMHASEIKSLLCATAMDIGEKGKDTSFGWGAPDVYKAILKKEGKKVTRGRYVPMKKTVKVNKMTGKKSVTITIRKAKGINGYDIRDGGYESEIIKSVSKAGKINVKRHKKTRHYVVYAVKKYYGADLYTAYSRKIKIKKK